MQNRLAIGREVAIVGIAHSTVFGYVRLGANATPEDRVRMHETLTAVAARSGYELTRVFFDSEEMATSAFSELVDALACSPVDLVLIPDLSHLGKLRSVQGAMGGLLEQQAGARILLVADSTEHPEYTLHQARLMKPVMAPIRKGL